MHDYSIESLVTMLRSKVDQLLVENEKLQRWIDANSAQVDLSQNDQGDLQDKLRRVEEFLAATEVKAQSNLEAVATYVANPSNRAGNAESAVAKIRRGYAAKRFAEDLRKALVAPAEVTKYWRYTDNLYYYRQVAGSNSLDFWNLGWRTSRATPESTVAMTRIIAAELPPGVKP